MASRIEAPNLTHEQIVGAALALIDEHGLDAFSMRNLARDLGVYPTALYWHVGNRDEVLGFALGRALFEIDPPDETLDWDGWIAEFARRFRATIMRHPNLAPIVASQMVSRSLTEFHIVEVILAKLEQAGFHGEALVDAYNVLVGSVVGWIGLELARLPDDDEWRDSMAGAMSGLSPEEMPHLAGNVDRLSNRAFGLRWLTGVEAPLDQSFEVMLGVVLHGLRAHLAGDLLP